MKVLNVQIELNTSKLNINKSMQSFIFYLKQSFTLQKHIPVEGGKVDMDICKFSRYLKQCSLVIILF